MARGRKTSLTSAEQLDNITKEIEEAETNLKELKQKKKDLEAQVKQEQLATLQAAIEESGISVEDAIAKIVSK